VAVALWRTGLALGMEFAGTAFALPALGSHTQLQLNIVKAHARTRMPRNFAVRDCVANTNYHEAIVNENDSQMQWKGNYFFKNIYP
jgi:hypothetical protein